MILAPSTWDDLLSDPEVEDIVCKTQGVFYFKSGYWIGPLAIFKNLAELDALGRRIAERAASQLGISNPAIDTQLLHEKSQNQFRAHVVGPPMSPLGIEITLRRLPSISSFSLDDFGFADPKFRNALEQAVDFGRSILITGATGSGKTSLLTALSRRFAPNTRVLLLEDCAELPLPNELSTRLLTRKDVFGFREGAVWDLEHLVFESLRMRPEKLILGECRGKEAGAILKALATGHRGVMTTLHAGSCNEGVQRFFGLAAAPIDTTAWDVIVHLQPDGKGRRYVRELIAQA